MLLEFEAEAEVMSSLSPFQFLLPSVGLVCYHLSLGWVLVLVLVLGFFFFFFGVSVARGFAIICWVCHMLFFSLDWFCFLICCLGLMLGFGQWACSITLLLLLLLFFRF